MASLDELEAGYQASIAPTGAPAQTLPFFVDATGQGWDRLGNPIGTGTTTTLPSISLDDLEKNFQASNFAEKADIISGQMAKGAAFGYGNELGAAEYAARTKLAGLLTGQQTPPISQLYEQKKQQYGAQDVAFEKTNPYAAAGLQIAGGLIPGILSGGSTLAAIPAQNLPTGATSALVRSLGGALYGSGTAGVPTLRDLAKSGAIGGAIYGSGEAENNRLMGAGIGAGIGTVAAPVVGSAVKGLGAVGRYGLDRLAESGAGQRLAQELSSQRGSISTKPVTGEVQTGGFTPAEIYVARKAKNIPIEQRQAGQELFRAAEETGVPLYLPDVLPTGDITKSAKMIANAPVSSAYLANIEARQGTAPSRMTEALDIVSPIRSTYEGGKEITRAAGDIIETAISERTRQTAPFYEQAFKDSPTVSLEAVQNLMKQDKAFKTAVTSLKQMARYADEPINSTKLILEARKELSGKIYTAKKEKGAFDALEFTYGKVNEILDQGAPMLREADAIYTQLTPPIDELKKSFLGTLIELGEKQISDLGTLFKLKPEQATALRDKFVNAGKVNEWNAGVRAALQEVVDKQETAAFATQLMKGSQKRNTIAALLGDTKDNAIDTTNQILQTLEHERLVQKGTSAYGAGGSQTQMISQQAEDLKGFLPAIQNFIKNPGETLITSLLQNSPSEELALDIAKIYFDPKTGQNVLGKIEPLLRKYEKNKALTEAIIAPVTKAAEKTGTIGAPSMLIPDVKPKKAAPIKVPEVAKETKVSVPKTDEFPQLKAVQGFTKKEVSSLIDEQPPFVRAVIQAESAGDPKAVSKVGAQGLMQIMPATAKDLGLKNPFDPKENIAAGTKYLTQLEQKYNDKALALAAYNWGPARVDSALRKAEKKGLGKGLEGIYEMLPAETKNYILKIAKIYNQSIKV
jgi:hypothetical protein